MQRSQTTSVYWLNWPGILFLKIVLLHPDFGFLIHMEIPIRRMYNARKKNPIIEILITYTLDKSSVIDLKTVVVQWIDWIVIDYCKLFKLTTIGYWKFSLLYQTWSHEATRELMGDPSKWHLSSLDANPYSFDKPFHGDNLITRTATVVKMGRKCTAK